MTIAAVAVAVVVAIACGRPVDERESEVSTAPAESGVPSHVVVGPIEPIRVRPGDRVTVEVPLRIADGFHVQANPAANEFLVPLELTLTSAPAVVVRPTRYPEASEHRVDGMAEPLRTYHGAIAVHAPIDVAESANEGARELAGTLRYQACDARRCFAPREIPVAFTAMVGH